MGGKRLKFPARQKYIPKYKKLGSYIEEKKDKKEVDLNYLQELGELKNNLKKKKREDEHV